MKILWVKDESQLDFAEQPNILSTVVKIEISPPSSSGSVQRPVSASFSIQPEVRFNLFVIIIHHH